MFIEDDFKNNEESIVEDSEPSGSKTPPQTTPQRPRLRDRSSLKQPERYECQVTEAEEFMALCCELEEPLTYTEAMTGDAAEKWQTAVKAELKALIENNTWEACKLPPDCKPIKAKWVFRIKRNKEGNPAKYKARLVAKGFLQRKRIDYKQTFAPVVRYESVRALLALAASRNYELGQLDITTAFLYAELDEEIFMELPEGCDKKQGNYCRLLKSLYGLKQSPRQWNRKFNDFLYKYNFIPSSADRCIYRGKVNDEEVLLALYVDDGLLAAKSKQTVGIVLERLKGDFRMTIGKADNYVGMEISRNPKTGEIFVGQSEYLKKVLEKFNMKDCKEGSVPMELHLSLSKNMGPTNKEEKEEMSKILYRQAVGSLMFAAVVSRPDIAYAVSCVSRFLDNPGREHWLAVKRILRYIKGTVDHGLLYKADDNYVLGYTDSDFSGCVDTRRSTSGYIFTKSGAAISWKSQLQANVNLSTTEAEYVASTEDAREAIWLRNLFDSMGDEADSVKLMIDNQSTIKWIQNIELHKRVKHIDVRFHFIREKAEEGIITVDYVRSADQLADILTKGLNKNPFSLLREKIGMIKWTDSFSE